MKKKLLGVIICVLSFAIVFINYVYADSSEKGPPCSHTYSTNYDAICNICGTIRALPTACNISSGVDSQKDMYVSSVDCDGKTKDQVEQMTAQSKNSDIVFGYNTSNTADTAMWDDSITMPQMSFTSSDGTIDNIINCVTDLYRRSNYDTFGGEIIDLSVSGVENYNYSYKVLNQLNSLRKSLNLQALPMDKELMEAAMQRAAELSIYYSHTRPNGESCFTVFNGYSGYCAENIAIGYKTPDEVMSAWASSSGHYDNMTNGHYSSAGIGCFQTSDGYLCWVQLFSSAKSKGTTKSGTSTASHSIEAKRAFLSLDVSPEQDIHKLDKGNYTKINVWNFNNGFPYSKQVIDSSSFNYSSTNNKVVTIDTNGYCTIKGNGAATVTVTPKHSYSFKLVTNYIVGHTYSNTSDRKCNYCGVTCCITHSYKTTTTKATTTTNGSIVKKCTVCGKVASTTTIKYAKTFKLSTTSYTYNGVVKKPAVTVKDSAGKTLKQGIDYTVTYSSGRKNVGTYKVTIKGKGNYTGTETLTFKINPSKTTVSKLTAGQKSITVGITKKSTQVTGYQIQYSTSSKFTNASTKTITSYKTTQCTLKNLSAKKTYYVRVRTYKTVNGTKYYSGWSTYKYVKTK